jgi:hypothetical protein
MKVMKIFQGMKEMLKRFRNCKGDMIKWDVVKLHVFMYDVEVVGCFLDNCNVLTKDVSS